MTTKKVAKTAKPVSKAAKPAKAKAAARRPVAVKRSRVAKSERQPRGHVPQILKLASRPKGVSPAELNKLTKWSRPPWKRIFPTYCARWGYKLSILDTDDGTRYRVAKR